MSLMSKETLVTALTQRLLSNFRVVMGNFKKMLKPLGGQENVAFFLRNATGVATTAQGGSKRKCLSLPKGQL